MWCDRLKGVSPILDLEVVQYDQRTVGNSSTQAPLDFIRLFIMPLKIVLFETSVLSLAWGCATQVNQRWICFSSHHSLKGLPSNWMPLSLIRIPGVSKRVRIFFHLNFITCFSMTMVRGSTAIDLVKQSTTASKNLAPTGEVGNFLKISTPLW